MKINPNKTKGGPAFPVTHSIDRNWVTDPREEYSGMTLRDYFAAQAPIANFLSPTWNGSDENIQGNAEFAYRWADAMLKTRNRNL